MSYFKAKMHQSPKLISAGSLPQTPLGSSPQTHLLYLSVPTSKGRGEDRGWEWEGKRSGRKEEAGEED